MDINIVSEYYDINYDLYTSGWSEEHFHYGFWFSDTCSHEESLENHIQCVVDELCIKNNEIILDSGCGNGGTCRYISKRYNSTIVGITLSNIMLENAIAISTRYKIDNINYYKMDFCNTDFPDKYFDKLLAIESSCHSNSKKDFLNESYRILKDGGMIVISDAFIIKEKMTAYEKKMFNEFIVGWDIPNLVSLNEFKEILISSGFKNIKYTDQLKLIKKSSEMIYDSAKELLPSIYHEMMSKPVNTLRLNHVIAQQRQFECINLGLWTHGRFIATK